uniref:Uncharacterized protein n=1 Tax=Meloidogyne hapla TaxID=6305 RepID=A0A1I8B8C7_MELHA
MDVDNDIEEGEFLHTFFKNEEEEKHQINEEHHFDEEMPTPPTLPSFLTEIENSDLTESSTKSTTTTPKTTKTTLKTTTTTSTTTTETTETSTETTKIDREQQMLKSAEHSSLLNRKPTKKRIAGECNDLHDFAFIIISVVVCYIFGR